jgi:hypothetical protein
MLLEEFHHRRRGALGGVAFVCYKFFWYCEYDLFLGTKSVLEGG